MHCLKLRFGSVHESLCLTSFLASVRRRHGKSRVGPAYTTNGRLPPFPPYGNDTVTHNMAVSSLKCPVVQMPTSLLDRLELGTGRKHGERLH